jgi:hypothetical protein
VRSTSGSRLIRSFPRQITSAVITIWSLVVTAWAVYAWMNPWRLCTIRESGSVTLI